MNERRRPSRRGRGPRPFGRPRTEILDEPTPYRETPSDNEGGNAPDGADAPAAPNRDWNAGGTPPPAPAESRDSGAAGAPSGPTADASASPPVGSAPSPTPP